MPNYRCGRRISAGRRFLHLKPAVRRRRCIALPAMLVARRLFSVFVTSTLRRSGRPGLLLHALGWRYPAVTGRSVAEIVLHGRLMVVGNHGHTCSPDPVYLCTLPAEPLPCRYQHRRILPSVLNIIPGAKADLRAIVRYVLTVPITGSVLLAA